MSAGAHDGWSDANCLKTRLPPPSAKGIPRGTGPLDLGQYCALSHLVVSSRGDPFTGFVDQTLAGLGYQRNVVMSTQSYAMAPPLVAGTDLICTLPGRMLQQFATTLDIFRPRCRCSRSPSACSGILKQSGHGERPGCANNCCWPPGVNPEQRW